MSTDTINRKRSVDVNKLNIEQAEQLTEQISKKITDLTDEVVSKVNKMLNIYGLEAKMQIAISSKDSEKLE